MIKKRIVWLVCSILAISLCACVAQQPPDEISEQQSSTAAESKRPVADYKVIDLMDRNVTIPAETSSYACIGPGALRLYCYVADKTQLAGVEEVEASWGEKGRPYSMAITAIEKYSSIGPGGPGNAPDAELLYAAAPDVIFTCYSTEASEVDELQAKLGIPVVALSYGSTSLFAPEVDRSLALIGRITGNEERAEKVLDYFAKSKEDLAARTAKVEKKPMVYLGCQSNRGSHGIESTSGNYELFRVLNAENVAATAGIPNYAMIDKEKILDMDPETIILDAGGFSIVQEDYAANPDFYNTLSAVKNGRVFLQMPFNYYATNIEIALADAYYIGTILYPEQFSDVDPAKKFDEITMELLGIAAYEQTAAAYYDGYQQVAFKN